MHARTNLEARLPSRHLTEEPVRAPHRFFGRGFEGVAFDAATVFKKTPYGADSKPAGRDVAKELFEVGGIPLLRKMLPDHGSSLLGGDIIVTERTLANLKYRVVTHPGKKSEKTSHADA